MACYNAFNWSISVEKHLDFGDRNAFPIRMTFMLDPSQGRRNRNYAETHRMLIEKAVDMISATGVETLSVSALARVSAMNRSTVYYHFDSRDSLIAEVKAWSAGQLAQGFRVSLDGDQPIARIIGFVLDNPEIIKLWLDDLIAPGDIRRRYPGWDELVAGAHAPEGVACETCATQDDGCCASDAEIFCAMQIATWFIAPRIFSLSIRPDEPRDRVIERFVVAQRRLMRMAMRNSDEQEAKTGLMA